MPAKRAAGELHSLPVHVMKGRRWRSKDARIFVTHLHERWLQRSKMEKVNVILADEGIFHDIYKQQGFSPWEHSHNTRLFRI